MLEIILTILKFIGIGIGILFAVVLILLLLALFIPVRYEVDGENSDKLQVKGKVHWLLRIVTFQITYENEEMKQVLRIFGVPVWRK